MADCPHLHVVAHAQNLRVTEVDGRSELHWVLVVTPKCVQCGRPFRFLGLPGGMSVTGPTMDATGGEARLPMVPMEPEARIC